MKEIVTIEPDNWAKCPVCRFESQELYRFESEGEDTEVCGRCFFRSIREDDLSIAAHDEVVVDRVVVELLDHALAEFHSGDLDGLEETLHSLTNRFPASATPPTASCK